MFNGPKLVFYCASSLCCWCRLKSLSMCFWLLFVTFLLLLHVLLSDSSQQVFCWLVISMLCMRCRFVLFPFVCFLKAVLWWGLCKWSCFCFCPPPRLCRLLSNTHFLLCCLLCLAHIMRKQDRCVFSLGKGNFYSFNVRSQRSKTYFLQTRLLNDGSKNMSILIFTCYRILYIIVIYTWINFIGCELLCMLRLSSYEGFTV